MRVISRISRMGTIVTALAILVSGGALAALAGCGQRGPLYLPAVPPLPPKPGYSSGYETQPQQQQPPRQSPPQAQSPQQQPLPQPSPPFQPSFLPPQP